MARCSLFGNDFVNTFDGSMYSFAGYCSYLLAGGCQKRSFSIIGKFWALQGGLQREGWLSSALVWGRIPALGTVSERKGHCREQGEEQPFCDT